MEAVLAPILRKMENVQAFFNLDLTFHKTMSEDLIVTNTGLRQGTKATRSVVVKASLFSIEEMLFQYENSEAKRQCQWLVIAEHFQMLTNTMF